MSGDSGIIDTLSRTRLVVRETETILNYHIHQIRLYTHILAMDNNSSYTGYRIPDEEFRPLNVTTSNQIDPAEGNMIASHP